MKYLCLIYDEEKTLETLPKSQLDALMGERMGSVEVRPIVESQPTT